MNDCDRRERATGANATASPRAAFLAALLLALLFYAGCSSVSDKSRSSDLGPTPAPAPTCPPVRPTIATYPAQVGGYIPNPAMGWQDTLVENKRFTETVSYVRNNWSTFNPAEGEYDWSEIEKLRERIAPSGGQISFRIQTAKPPPWGTGHGIPDWLVASGAVTREGSLSSEPLYAGCLFLEAHGEFIDALRQRYDGDPEVAFIDVGSYGFYGEWHSDQYEWDNDGGLDWHARRRIIDMYLGGENSRPCLTTSGEVITATYQYDGFQQIQLLMPYTPGYADSLHYALSRRQDIGIRHDALGSEKHQQRYREEIGELVQEVWPHEPIVFEFYPEAYTDDSLRLARDFAEEMHASYLHENFDGQGSNALVERVLEKVGYRLTLRQVVAPVELRATEPLTVTMFWENTGTAPPYVAFPLVVLLNDQAGETVATQVVETDIREWMPGEPVPLSVGVDVPDTLAPGPYRMKLAFVSTDTRQPAISLAVAETDEAGYYPVGEIEVLP